MFDFATRLDSVALAAWERWTRNGRAYGHVMDGAEMVETFETARDEANNVYVDGISDGEWWRETCRRLGVEFGEA